MKNFRALLNSTRGLPALAVGVMAFAFSCQATIFPLPSDNEVVARATTATNLEAVARQTTDPAVWLGLSFLAQAGDPVRTKLTEMAVKAKPEFGPVAILLVNAMDDVSKESTAELVRRDPDNALGYYLSGNRLFAAGNKKESLDALRKGAACAEFRLYGGVVSNVLFKALDVLSLNGRDRLCASSWMAARWQNFEIGNLQPLNPVLGALAKDAGIETRKEISDVMLAAAAHLIASDLMNRNIGEGMLQMAFRLKADIAASEKSPTMNGYAAVVRALVSTKMSWPGFKRQDPMEVATFAPGWILSASTFIDPSGPKYLRGKESILSDADRPAFEKAKDTAFKAAKALVDAVLPVQDEIMGAYFCGRMPPRTNAPAPWSESPTYVERLMLRHPDLFTAVAADQDAGRALDQAATAGGTASTSADPVIVARVTCIENLRRIDSAKQQWALEMGRRAEDTPLWSDLQPYLGGGKESKSLPKCPSGGAYTIGKVGEKPKCTVPGHVLP